MQENRALDMQLDMPPPSEALDSIYLTQDSCCSGQFQKLSLEEDLERMEDIRKTLRKMKKHDIRSFIVADEQLRNALKQEDREAIYEEIICSITSDRASWEGLMTKHEGVRDFFSNWYQRKMDEKHPENQKAHKPRSRYELRRIQRKKNHKKHAKKLLRNQTEKNLDKEVGIRRQSQGAKNARSSSSMFTTMGGGDCGGANQDEENATEKSKKLSVYEQAQEAVRLEQLEQEACLSDGDCISVEGAEIDEKSLMEWQKRVSEKAWEDGVRQLPLP